MRDQFISVVLSVQIDVSEGIGDSFLDFITISEVKIVLLAAILLRIILDPSCSTLLELVNGKLTVSS